MKKAARIFISLILALATMLSLAACGGSGAPAHDVTAPRYEITADKIMPELEAFVTVCKDRTSCSDEETEAAEYIRGRLLKYGYVNGEPMVDGVSEESAPTKNRVKIASFTGKESDKEVNSQNVVAVYGDTSNADAKNVIIGAFYDNRYESPSFTTGSKGTKAEGALSNGTGVATLLAIAEYLYTNNVQLGYNVTMVFFGDTISAALGAKQFYNSMTAAERKNTVLMIELQRLGGDHIYAFSDVRETRREGFFDGIIADNGLDVYKPSKKSAVITGTSLLRGIPYYQWYMQGNYFVFFNSNIPTLNLMGANWETMDLTDRESADYKDMEMTSDDTLENLKKRYPDCGDKMAAAATVVIKSLTSPDFLDTMKYDRDNFPDTDTVSKSWIWYLIAFGIAVIAYGIMMLISNSLAKKYRPAAPKVKKMKMAVFGMEYEDKKPDEIYIDIKPTGGDDIFPGVPNNESGDDHIDGIFPLIPIVMASGMEKPQPPAEQTEEKTEQPVEQPVEQKPEEPAEQPAEQTEEKSAEQPAEQKPEGPVEQKSAAAKKPAAKKPTAKKPAATQKAGEGAAKKPTRTKKPGDGDKEKNE